MADNVNELIQHLTRAQSRTIERSLIGRLGALILRNQAGQLIEHLDQVASGTFETSDADELSAIVRWFAAESAICSLIIVEPMLPELPKAIRDKTFLILSELFDSASIPVGGDVRVVSTSNLRAVEDRLLLTLALRAASQGLDVRVVTVRDLPPGPPFELVLSGPSGNLVISVQQHSDPLLATWLVNAQPDARSVAMHRLADLGDAGLVEATVSLPEIAAEAWPSAAEESETETSVIDLFGDLITLRDLQPRSSGVRGLYELRSSLGLGAPFVPRKNEKDYARVARTFVDDLVGTKAQIIYVGDTVFNDGSVICNLDAGAPGSVFGFLCNEKGFGHLADFILGPVYFAKQWRSLNRFLVEGIRRGITFDSNTVGLFDLDQTVYAAKGRNDEALYQSRWEAISEFLRDTIPSYKFDARRAEAIYRQFDQDEYHLITRDNMDYVVLLVLAVAAGLCDAREIETFAASRENSIASLTELLHQRALVRSEHEDIGRVLEVIRAVHYNTLAGDQTPCKEFRRYECRSTALRMRGEELQEGAGQIFLNREVVDFIRFLKNCGTHVMAVSDRPVEAAVIEDDDGKDGLMKTDLMAIPMKALGFPIYDLLKNYA